MLRVKNKADLEAIGIEVDPTDQTKAKLIDKVKCPTVGHLAELIDQAKALRVEIEQQERELRKAERYKTALHWRYGHLLQAIYDKSIHGEWGPALERIGEDRRRADEFRKFAQFFATEAEAGKHTVRQALRLIRKGERPAAAKPSANDKPQEPKTTLDGKPKAPAKWIDPSIVKEDGYEPQAIPFLVPSSVPSRLRTVICEVAATLLAGGIDVAKYWHKRIVLAAPEAPQPKVKNPKVAKAQVPRDKAKKALNKAPKEQLTPRNKPEK